MEIEFVNYSYTYKDNNILHDISFKVETGDFLAVLGHNGCGKSTIIKSIVKENIVSNGMIYVDGVDINKFSDFSKIGYVSQDFNEFSFNYPMNVMEVLRTSYNNVEKILEVLNRFNIGELAYENINNLSGGQLQRVFIVRALLHDPKVIVLDEPFSNADENSTKEMLSMLKMYAECGVSVILVTHHLHLISDYASKVLALDKSVFYYGDISSYDERMCSLC